MEYLRGGGYAAHSVALAAIYIFPPSPEGSVSIMALATPPNTSVSRVDRSVLRALPAVLAVTTEDEDMGVEHSGALGFPVDSDSPVFIYLFFA